MEIRVMFRLYHLNKYTDLRKNLRNNATEAEIMLWRYLRGRRLHGLKFRRQESIGRYIVDFYCPDQRLAVEVDGKIHNTDEQKAYDRERERFLNACHIKVVRFTNQEVMNNIAGVLEKLGKAVPPHPKPLPN